MQLKSLAGQKKGEERIGNTVERFDEPGGDFCCNLKGRGHFGPTRAWPAAEMLGVAAVEITSFDPGHA